MTQTELHHLPARVGVYGGGRMGAGIAHTFLISGSSVVVVEASDAAAAAARARLEDSVQKAAARGTARDAPDVVLSRLTVETDARALEGTGLVVEAVPEDVDLKATVLARVEEAAPDAWLATNTSSLSIDGLAAGLRRPDRFVGLHFFNPVPVSTLVEIVAGKATSSELVALSRSWVAGIGKQAIVVRDQPGFASSRLGVALALEAMRMLEAEVASAEDIDKAMTLGYKHPMGPLRTTDVVGLDVRLAIAEHLSSELGPRFEPPAILKRMVAEGRLGRKTGQGFFAW